MAELNLGIGASVPAELREETVSSWPETGGFGFENHHRNARIAQDLAKAGKQVSRGVTIMLYDIPFCVPV